VHPVRVLAQQQAGFRADSTWGRVPRRLSKYAERCGDEFALVLESARLFAVGQFADSEAMRAERWFGPSTAALRFGSISSPRARVVLLQRRSTMGFPFSLALRYMGSRKRASVSVGTLLAILGVALGTMALVTVLSVTGGFRSQFREKVLGVNAHVLVLKYASEFREYRDVMSVVEKEKDVLGASPFVINPMMVTHEQHTATGVLLKGVDPSRMQKVLDLPSHMIEGSLGGLRIEGAKPPERMAPVHSYVAGEPGEGDFTEGNLIDEIEREIEKAKQAKNLKAAPDGAPPGPPPVGVKPKAVFVPQPVPVHDPFPDKGAPVGAIEPGGGFGSQLPDEDVLTGLVSDPCQSSGSAELPGIVIGATLKATLGVKLGDCVQVTSPTIGYSFSEGQLRPPVAKQFRVQGIFQAGFDQYDSKLMYTDLYQAQAFYGAGDTVTGVEMRIRDIDDSAAVTQRIDALLNNGIYHAMDWEELNHGLFTALRIQQILMSLVLALIILVAAFTVIATLIMIVFDKKREIAVLKSMGASDLSLLRTFLYQGLIIGVIGTSVGLGLGFALCRWILIFGFPLDPKVYFISKLPVIIRPGDFMLTGVFAVIVCLLACMWPALHAARLRPAEAFREQ
jgi:lipoprotein-releasing system permease protein